MSGPTRVPMRMTVFCAMICAFITVPAFAAGFPAVAITGEVQHPQNITLPDIEKRPQTTIHVSFQSAHGQEEGTFTVTLLWPLLGDAGLIDAPGKNSRLRHSILVTGRDGYAVALSVGELDPDFEGKSVILAYAKDGKPLDPADGIRLIVAGDRHGGRDVREVVTIDVR